jgi:signal transduction histidine kinase
MISDGLRAIRPTDVALAGGFAAFGLLEEYFIRMPGGWWPYLLAGVCALILVRRSIPLLAMLPHVFAPIDMFYVQTTIAGERTVNFRLWQMVAMMIAAYTVGRCVPPTSRSPRSVLGVVLILLTTGMYLWFDDGDPMAALFFPLAPYGLGVAVAVQARRTDEAASARAAIREQQAREAVMEERVRIARELHDVIGHALSQINVQASVGLHLMDRDAEQARTALASIKDTSKTALEEVRSVLGVIRDGEAPLAPQAELAELPRLVAGVRSPDFDAQLVDRLDAPPRRAVQFAAYRIAQEALTNVVRHASASRAVVTVDHVGDELVLTVDDDGAGLRGAEGSGILGMRERASLLGGSVQLTPSPLGGTRVAAHLPWGGVA